jgi:uncharacterized protein
MSIQPPLIDNIAFAKRGEHLAGVLPLVACSRLAELLASQAPNAANTLALSNGAVRDNNIHYTLDGEANAAGQYFLHLTLTSNLTTFCQRCLEVMTLNLNLNFHYRISDVSSSHLEIDGTEDNDDYDLQEASQTMSLTSLIEDELIMALPIAPAHGYDCATVSSQSGEKPNPFAVLKDLIKS